MIEQHLETIRAEEREAKARAGEAEARAAEVIEKAHADGRKHIDDVGAEAADLERTLRAQATRKAEEEIADARAESAKLVAALGVIAKRNHEQALELIMKAFRAGE